MEQSRTTWLIGFLALNTVVPKSRPIRVILCHLREHFLGYAGPCDNWEWRMPTDPPKTRPTK